MKVNEIEEELKKLIEEGFEFVKNLDGERREFMINYESWYTKSLIYVKRMTPDRVNDFKNLYQLGHRREITLDTYTISDALRGIELKGSNVTPKNVWPKLLQQVTILKGVKEVLKSKIYNLQELLQADIFDNELNSAKELNKKGFYRAAGAMCGVVLEEHFSRILEKNNINLKKKNLTINDYNDALKNNDLIDIATFRHIQLLGDFRNLCDHKKEQDPTKEDIDKLIEGTDEIIKTVI